MPNLITCAALATTLVAALSAPAMAARDVYLPPTAGPSTTSLAEGDGAVVAKPPSCYVIVDAAKTPLDFKALLFASKPFLGAGSFHVRPNGAYGEIIATRHEFVMAELDIQRFDLGVFSGSLARDGYVSWLDLSGKTVACATLIDNKPTPKTEEE